MAYIPKWERLFGARERLVVAGRTKREAETDLCAAMSDGEIVVRPDFELIKCTILDHQIFRRHRRKIFSFVRALQDGAHKYPEPWTSMSAFSIKGVTPRQLDWQKSVFLNPWSVPIHPEMAPMNWRVSIEVSSVDVTRVLIQGSEGKLTTKVFIAKAADETAAIKALATQLKRTPNDGPT